MINRAPRNGRAEHFFETEGLGAKLHIVVVPSPLLAALVLDGERNFDEGLAALPRPRRLVEFDEVGPPVQPEPFRRDPEPPLGADPPSLLVPRPISPGVELIAAKGVFVVDVKSVQMPEGSAAVAVKQSVEGGEGDEVVPLGVACHLDKLQSRIRLCHLVPRIRQGAVLRPCNR